MEQTNTSPAPAAETTTILETADPKRPKVLSVSQPDLLKLAKPRVLTQISSTPQPKIQVSQQLQPNTHSSSLTTQPALQPERLAEPKTDADWTEQTLSQAEKDAEEQRMASDITQAFAAPATSTAKQDEKQADAVAVSKIEPKSVPGLLYAIKGFASSVSRKILGK